MIGFFSDRQLSNPSRYVNLLILGAYAESASKVLLEKTLFAETL